jgi:hypothetical protein
MFTITELGTGNRHAPNYPSLQPGVEDGLQVDSMRFLGLVFEVQLPQNSSKANRPVVLDSLPSDGRNDRVRLTHTSVIEDLVNVELIENGNHDECHRLSC